MPKNIPALKPRQLIQLLVHAGCQYYREGKGDHRLYIRMVDGRKRAAPIDMGARDLSPAYVLRILREFGLTDAEIDGLFR